MRALLGGVCVWVVLASVQRRLFVKYYGFGSSCLGTSGEVIEPVSSTLQIGVSPKAAELCSVSE